MGHYRSEMYSAKELEDEEQRAIDRKARRIEAIEKAIAEKGLARFLAELRVSSFDGEIIV